MAKMNPIEIQQALKGASYPADRKSLTDVAKKNKAQKEVVEKISHLKSDRFDGPDQVEKEMFHG